MPIFYQKYVYSLKTHCSHTHISQKNVHILKNTVLSCVFFFFKFFMKNSCCRAHDWSKNVDSVKTTLYSGPKKSIWCPFFLFLTKKNYCSFVHILSKNVHSLKRNSSHRQFCQNQNTWWAIKVHKMPFFSDSSRKNRCSHTHILSQVRLFSKEHTALKFMFYEKMSVLSKTLCSCHFFKFFMKNPLLSSPYMVKKRQICQNYTILGQKRQ